MKPKLFLHGVTLAFGGLTVIDSLDIQVMPGSRTGLIGPNGAGKTTVFNLISGVYRPNAGEILLDDEAIDAVPLDRRVRLGIGRTFQNLRMMKHLTVLENIMLGQHTHVGLWQRMLVPLNSPFNRAGLTETRAAAQLMGLSAHADLLADGLPYGVQKRIEIARALVTRPRLLLLDEPAAGLNSSERDELLSILLTQLPKEMSVLIVEHDVAFVSSLCDHVVALNFGRKIAEGRAEAVCSHPAVIEAYLGKDDDAADADAGVPAPALDETIVPQESDQKSERAPGAERGTHAA
ncbi:ABC transporter ATP-binding protein [Xanthobacter tagetidis]|uniref:ABC transporter ATP-binding protein n=1 Tax=Xanthobacter tagetidis TaxID=60216 RepID=A0A3L7AD79_9HYPH|nr:ABC transporter ATP-binding protein [Xanthobacter tagetidis]MBB6305825.1 branched-chain amino acid transport system ATP-binding protein [Xanthobacter tagetidis]RLP78349.1 ABC transporter ATP-binding protein [Xanthobacter tagetidis]